MQRSCVAFTTKDAPPKGLAWHNANSCNIELLRTLACGGEGSLRLSLFRLIPALMLLLFVAWCSTGRQQRSGVEGAPHLQVELAELFAVNGLVDGPVNTGQLATIAERVGPAGMNRLLYAAAAEASLPALRWIVKHGADPRNIGVIEAVPLLHKVAKRPQVERLGLFLGLGLDSSQRDAEGRSVMHVCAEAGMDEAVLALLRGKGLTTADTTVLGRQAIHLASVKSIAALSAGGADLAATDNKGQTALHIAAAAGRQDLVTELLRFGASVFAVDKQGRTPLHWAALSKSEATVDALLARNAPRTARDNMGLTPRDLAETERQPTYRNERDHLRNKL
jgi:Ankyrin repeats (3 copies)